MQVGNQSFRDWPNRFRSISDLQGDDATTLGRRIGCDVGKVAVERNKHGVELVSFIEDGWIGRIGGQALAKPHNIVPGGRQQDGHTVWHTVI